MNARPWLPIWLEWLLLGFGLGCLGSVTYDAVDARRFQARLAAEFARDAQAYAPVTVRAGGLLGMLDIPRLSLTTPVIEGDGVVQLRRAVGHLPDTPLPWQRGNSALAGHRDGLFRPLKDIVEGDEVIFRTSRQILHYRVTRTSIVAPDDVSVLDAKSGADLTLVTCFPFYYVGNAPKRFIVHARRVDASPGE
jgi:LPXTG-site transpeptidase (sortase) family protein